MGVVSVCNDGRLRVISGKWPSFEIKEKAPPAPPSLFDAASVNNRPHHWQSSPRVQVNMKSCPPGAK